MRMGWCEGGECAGGGGDRGLAGDGRGDAHGVGIILFVKDVGKGGLVDERRGTVAAAEEAGSFRASAVAKALLTREFFLDGSGDDLFQTLLDFAFAVAAKVVADVVPEEEHVGEAAEDETEGGDGPDDEREEHGEEDDGVLVLGLCEDFDVVEELRAITGAVREQDCLHDGVERDSVDGLARALCDDDAHGALELKVGEKSDVIDALFALS